ncbi:hypothetical protein Csa_002814 [Cucumis sativus]|uniref:Uncharacterized protein n=1 Tax=Cucumis sativus TaxID=3659 RepID=A0A0A0KHB3_CUCSA|nr:hypothetical protein Csa_002814 [Cucumis sativus]
MRFPQLPRACGQKMAKPPVQYAIYDCKQIIVLLSNLVVHVRGSYYLAFFDSMWSLWWPPIIQIFCEKRTIRFDFMKHYCDQNSDS